MQLLTPGANALDMNDEFHPSHQNAGCPEHSDSGQQPYSLNGFLAVTE